MSTVCINIQCFYLDGLPELPHEQTSLKSQKFQDSPSPTHFPLLPGPLAMLGPPLVTPTRAAPPRAGWTCGLDRDAAWTRQADKQRCQT